MKFIPHVIDGQERRQTQVRAFPRKRYAIASRRERPHLTAGSSYLLVVLLTARTAESMISSSRLLWAPRQYTWPQLWQRENAW